MSKPTVTVIIPCKDDGEFIRETLDSVVAQTYSPIEVVIVDDGSIDIKTCSILDTLKSRFTIIYEKSSRGPAAARNIGIKNSTGEFVLPLDSDDIIAPTYIEKAVNVALTNHNIGIVYCEAEFFGKRKGKWELPPFSSKQMALDNCIFATALFRRSDWEAVGGYDERLVHGNEDYDFWLSIIEKDREVYCIQETLFFYRIKSVSRSTKFANGTVDEIAATYHRIYQNHPRFFNMHMYEILRERIVLSNINAKYSRLVNHLRRFGLHKMAYFLYRQTNKIFGD